MGVKIGRKECINPSTFYFTGYPLVYISTYPWGQNPPIGYPRVPVNEKIISQIYYLTISSLYWEKNKLMTFILILNLFFDEKIGGKSKNLNKKEKKNQKKMKFNIPCGSWKNYPWVPNFTSGYPPRVIFRTPWSQSNHKGITLGVYIPPHFIMSPLRVLEPWRSATVDWVRFIVI